MAEAYLVHTFDDASQPCSCGAGPYEAHRPFRPPHPHFTVTPFMDDEEINALADLIRATPVERRHDKLGN